MRNLQLMQTISLATVAAMALIQAGCNKKAPHAAAAKPTIEVQTLSKNVQLSADQQFKLSTPNGTLELNRWQIPTLLGSHTQNLTKTYTFDSKQNIRFGVALKNLDTICGLRGPRPTIKFELRTVRNKELVSEDMELLTSGAEIEPDTGYILKISFQGSNCRSLNLQFAAWATEDTELTGAGFARNCEVKSTTDSDKRVYIVEQSRKEFASDLRVLREKTGSLFDESSILIDFKKACDEEFEDTDLNESHGCTARNGNSVVCEYPRGIAALLSWSTSSKTQGKLKCVQGTLNRGLLSRPGLGRNLENGRNLRRETLDEDSISNDFKLSNCKDAVIGWSF